VFHPRSRDEWRTWLADNHRSLKGVWLCSWRTGVEGERCLYPDAVEEAISFGWIDSTKALLDERRNLQLFTPRKPKSSWTRLNRRRAQEMEAAGLMTDAGRASIEVAKANGWWTIYDAVEDLIEPDDLKAALDRDPSARAHWDSVTPSTRKLMLWQVISAIKPETRARRIEQIVNAASASQL